MTENRLGFWQSHECISELVFLLVLQQLLHRAFLHGSSNCSEFLGLAVDVQMFVECVKKNPKQ